MTAAALLGAASATKGGMPQQVTGGNAGPATSGSDGSFWTDISNGDFIIGGSKNSAFMTITIAGLVGVCIWLYLRK